MIDTTAMASYARYWNERLEKDPGIMVLQYTEQDSDVMFTALHSGSSEQKVTPVEMLLGSEGPVTFGAAYTSSDDTISFVLPAESLSETPTRMRLLQLRF